MLTITSTDKKVTIDFSSGQDSRTYPLNYLSYQKTDNGITLLCCGASVVTTPVSLLTVNGTQATPDNIDELLDPLFKVGGGGGVTLPIEIADVNELQEELDDKLEKQNGDGTLFLADDDTYKSINQVPAGGTIDNRFLYWYVPTQTPVWLSSMNQTDIDNSTLTARTIPPALLKTNLDKKQDKLPVGYEFKEDGIYLNGVKITN